jgi:hypothetical protein
MLPRVEGGGEKRGRENGFSPVMALGAGATMIANKKRQKKTVEGTCYFCAEKFCQDKSRLLNMNHRFGLVMVLGEVPPGLCAKSLSMCEPCYKMWGRIGGGGKEFSEVLKSGLVIQQPNCISRNIPDNEIHRPCHIRKNLGNLFLKPKKEDKALFTSNMNKQLEHLHNNINRHSQWIFLPATIGSLISIEKGEK